MIDMVSYHIISELPPSPGAQTLEKLRRHGAYQDVLEIFDEDGGQASLRPALLAESLETLALLGNPAGVLAFLESGVPPAAAALEAALRSVQPGALACARLLFDAGARIQRPH
ncbi:hypothetical protein [Stenotrophomonas acidaminiphila]|uniref:hypothetical protein n=1 Tax=Stenotrophomonas acidaminiphila TaxID=128780 RepID=UPI0020C6E575|nr:hypothetical protein [Stenotrophomonas acidaminiphila]